MEQKNGKKYLIWGRKMGKSTKYGAEKWEKVPNMGQKNGKEYKIWSRKMGKST